MLDKVIIKMTTATNKNDYRGALKISIDGKDVLSFMDGEPEDANLSRDFSDGYSVLSLMERAFNLGKEGYEVTFAQEEITWEEYCD